MAIASTKLAVFDSLESRTLLSHSPPAGDLILDWNNQALAAIRAAKTSPPVAARNLAIVHLALFDAINAIEDRYNSYLPDQSTSLKQKNPFKHADPSAAAAAAAHQTLINLYPALKPNFDQAFSTSLAAIKDGPAETAGVALGRSIADRLLLARANDGATTTLPYTPGTTPSSWQPTPPAFAPALLPNWPHVTPFALATGDQFRPAPPPALTSLQFTAAFDQVKALGSATGSARTADQTQIALFWADGAGTATPPGHWNQIAQDIADSRHTTHSLIDTARLFALLNAGLADAGIACWDSKYAFNFLRPVTAIRSADLDGNPLTLPDSAWSPLLATPPFPSYVSGHSTFSAAAANILSSLFGTDQIHFTTTSDGLANVQRSYTRLSDAANEAGLSRIYGGIHYAFDNTAGLALGQQIGAQITKTLLTRERKPNSEPQAPHANACPDLRTQNPPAAALSLTWLSNARNSLLSPKKEP